MSTPTLTPLDTPIFDEDVMSELEKHFDEAIPCAACDTEATIRISMRCCGATAFACAPHHQQWKQWFMTRRAFSPFAMCGDCGRILPAWMNFADLVSEVPL